MIGVETNILQCISLFSFNNEQFKENFRVSWKQFEEIERKAALTLMRTCDGGNATIPPRKQLMVVIWLLSNQETYR